MKVEAPTHPLVHFTGIQGKIADLIAEGLSARMAVAAVGLPEDSPRAKSLLRWFEAPVMQKHIEKLRAAKLPAEPLTRDEVIDILTRIVRAEPNAAAGASISVGDRIEAIGLLADLMGWIEPVKHEVAVNVKIRDERAGVYPN